MPLIVAAAATIFAFVLIKYLVPAHSYPVVAAIRIALGWLMIGALFLIGEKSVTEYEKFELGYAIKYFWPFFALAGLLMGLYVFLAVLQRFWIVPGWAGRLGLWAVVCLAVGFFEEMLFRAVLPAGIYRQFDASQKKSVFIWAAVISSLIFGFVHVAADVFAGPLTAMGWTQCALKTLSTAVAGCILLIIYWKTHCIWCCVIVHAIFDFIPNIPNALFTAGTEINNEYIMTGGNVNAGIAIVLYLVQFVAGMIVLICMRKQIKTIDRDSLLN